MKKITDITALIKLLLLMFLFFFIYDLGNTKRLELLINPKYFLLIFLSEIILLIFLIYLFFNIFSWKKDVLKSKSSNKRNFYILIIIILLLIFQFSPNIDIFFLNTAKLKRFNTSYAKSKTNLTVNNQKKNIYEKENNSEIKINKDETSENNNIDFVITDNNFISLINSIHQNIDDYMDKTVRIKGFVFKIEDLDKNHFIISRMAMFCCAADASVIGLICNIKNLNFNFIENDWFEIEAVITEETLCLNSENRILPVLKVINYKKTDRMLNPFVYPNYK